MDNVSVRSDENLVFGPSPQQPVVGRLILIRVRYYLKYVPFGSRKKMLPVKPIF